jgi:hypothetical protein
MTLSLFGFGGAEGPELDFFGVEAFISAGVADPVAAVEGREGRTVTSDLPQAQFFTLKAADRSEGIGSASFQAVLPVGLEVGEEDICGTGMKGFREVGDGEGEGRYEGFGDEDGDGDTITVETTVLVVVEV